MTREEFRAAVFAAAEGLGATSINLPTFANGDEGVRVVIDGHAFELTLTSGPEARPAERAAAVEQLQALGGAAP